MWQSEKKQLSGVLTNAFGSGHKQFDYLFIHGFLESAKMWKSVVESLNSEIQFFAPDLPGHGKSEMIEGNPEIEQLADWIKPLLQQNKRPVFVVAHSLGGYLALEMANRFPDLIAGIFLLHSTTIADSAERKASRDQGKRVVKTDKLRYLKPALEGLFLEQFKPRLNSQIETLIEEASEMKTDDIVWYLEAMKNRSSHTETIANRDFPLIYFTGEKDPILSIENHREEVKVTKPEKIFLTENAGHMAHLEQPAELTSALQWCIERFGQDN
ncbi:alpha/beta fold hydrolase [Halocola ammonii]